MPKVRKLSFFVVLGVSLVIVLTIIGQETEKTGDQMPFIIKSQQTTEQSKVAAIRKVNLLVGDLAPDGSRYEKLLPHVEIELYVGEPNFNTQLQYLVQIGDREFLVTRWNPFGGRYNAVLLMPVSEFDELKDGAEISFSVGIMMPREDFKKLYDEGKLPENHARKIGKLDKKMIDLEPTVEKSADWKPLH